MGRFSKLFAGFGSAVSLVRLARVLASPGSAARRVSATLACAPAGSVPKAHTKPFAVCVIDPVLGVAAMRLAFGDKLTARMALVAVFGPRLEMMRLHGNAFLVWAEYCVAEAVSVRSAS